LEEKRAKEEDDPNYGEGLGFFDGTSDSFDLGSDPQCLDLQVQNMKLGLYDVRLLLFLSLS